MQQLSSGSRTETASDFGAAPCWLLVWVAAVVITARFNPEIALEGEYRLDWRFRAPPGPREGLQAHRLVGKVNG
jgi:hypothetical protein